MKFKLIIIIVQAGVLLTNISVADMTWKLIDLAKESGETIITGQTIFITKNKFAIETDDGMRIILNVIDNTFTVINNNEKTFNTTSLQEMEKKVTDMKSETDKMIEEALKNIPENQRGQYEEMLKQQVKDIEKNEDIEPQWEKFKSTGKTTKIAGYNAVQYVSTGVEGTTYEMWCSKEVEMSEVQDFFENIQKISFFKEMSKNYNVLNFGFPLKTVNTIDDYEYSSEVTSINYGKTPISVFELPEGYNKTESIFQSK